MRNSMETALFASGIGATALLEAAMWMLYRRRAEGLQFPPEADASQLRFFTAGRIRACAAAHAVFLLASVALLFLLAW